MDITVTITNLTPRQEVWAAAILDDINVGRLPLGLPAFPNLSEWAADEIKKNLKTMVHEKESLRGEIRKEQWISATDAQRAAVDAALGVE